MQWLSKVSRTSDNPTLKPATILFRGPAPLNNVKLMLEPGLYSGAPLPWASTASARTRIYDVFFVITALKNNLKGPLNLEKNAERSQYN
jgi:hypothetical protein